MVFNALKAAQAIAYFGIREQNRQIAILKAIKLLYLADRECFARHGFPVVDDVRVSMPHGPVNSKTYSHINGELESDEWNAVLSDRANHEVEVKRNVEEDDLDELSECELECLETVWKQFGNMTKWEIRNWTHDSQNVPEWEDPGQSSKVIPVERILNYLGVENADGQAALLNEFQSIDRLFSKLRD